MASPDQLGYTPEKRAAVAKGVEQAKRYNVYGDFPPLPDLIAHKYTPTSILVTGAAGFIASHVAIRLARLYPKYRIIGVDKMSYCSDERNIVEPLKECTNFRFVKGNICDYDHMLHLMREEKVDTVMHLAAQSHVDLSFKEGGPRQFVLDNVQGTASLLEAARTVNVKRFLHCSTDEVYGEGSFENRIDFDEDAKMRPNNPYSASKAGADLLAQSFYQSYGFPVVITRGNNVYGPHQFYEKVVPKFIAQLKSGRKITIHGSGGNTRNFLHVQDTASAFDAVLHCGDVGAAYNIGGRNEKTVLSVAADLLLVLGLDHRCQELVQYVADRAHNDACYPISNGKLLELGWREQISWELGLANTVTWFLERLRSEERNLAGVLEAHPEHNSTDATLRTPTAISTASNARARL